MHLIAIEHHPAGLQIKVCGYHLHHGVIGLGLVVIGASMAFHDRRDWNDWFWPVIEG